jgi:MarR family transcriptional regulator, organic hydroperoxide resistance regulator
MKYNFNESIGFIIVKAGRLIENKLKYDFEKAGINITPQQWSVLTYLWNEDGISQQKIADAFSKDKTSITRLLNNMEKHNLILRKQDDIDKRNNKIFLTELSESLRKDSIKIAEKTLIEILNGVDHQSLKLSKKVLKQINKNLEKELNI